MKKIALLGHDNTSLSVILDIIFKSVGPDSHVRIISNLPPEDNSQYQLPFDHPRLPVQIVPADSWQRDQEEILFAASMSSKARFKIYRYFKDTFALSDTEFGTLLHPFADIAQGVSTKPGVIINPGVVVAPYTMLDAFVYLNRHCSIGHHSQLGAFVSVNPGAVINGKCQIGAHTTIGAGAVINDGISIGAHSIVGSGAVVVKDLPDHVVAVGNPARILRHLETE